MTMSLDETPVRWSSREGGTIGKLRGRSTVPSLYTRIHVGISVTIFLAVVEGVEVVVEAI